MILRLLLSLNLLLLTLQVACAQSADDFFHGGAQPYLSNHIDKAKEEVENGLKIYPNDTKLQKLDELLKRQQQAQDNQQNKEEQQKQQQQQAQDNQQKQTSEKKEQQQQQQQQAQDQKREQEQQKQQQQQAKSDSQKEPRGEPQKTYAVGQMTPQQAQQLLDAQKGDESLLLFKPEGKPENAERKIKDW